MYCYAFESSYGYNSIVRLGKIYTFTSEESMMYLIDVNRDLKVLNHAFRVFTRYVKHHLILHKIKKYFTPKHLFLIQHGEKSIEQIINEIKSRIIKQKTIE